MMKSILIEAIVILGLLFINYFLNFLILLIISYTYVCWGWIFGNVCVLKWG